MRRINQYLNPRLINICEQATRLEELNSKLHLYLPLALQEHCSVGSFNGGCLVIVINDAVWASELRYHLPELRETLRKEAGVYQLTSIKISIATLPDITVAKESNPSALSSKAREAITACGEQCSYEPLKQALEKLAGK